MASAACGIYGFFITALISTLIGIGVLVVNIIFKYIGFVESSITLSSCVQLYLAQKYQYLTYQLSASFVGICVGVTMNILVLVFLIITIKNLRAVQQNPQKLQQKVSEEVLSRSKHGLIYILIAFGTLGNVVCFGTYLTIYLQSKKDSTTCSFSYDETNQFILMIISGAWLLSFLICQVFALIVRNSLKQEQQKEQRKNKYKQQLNITQQPLNNKKQDDNYILKYADLNDQPSNGQVQSFGNHNPKLSANNKYDSKQQQSNKKTNNNVFNNNSFNNNNTYNKPTNNSTYNNTNKPSNQSYLKPSIINNMESSQVLQPSNSASQTPYNNPSNTYNSPNSNYNGKITSSAKQTLQQYKQRERPANQTAQKQKLSQSRFNQQSRTKQQQNRLKPDNIDKSKYVDKTLNPQNYNPDYKVDVYGPGVKSGTPKSYVPPLNLNLTKPHGQKSFGTQNSNDRSTPKIFNSSNNLYNPPKYYDQPRQIYEPNRRILNQPQYNNPFSKPFSPIKMLNQPISQPLNNGLSPSKYDLYRTQQPPKIFNKSPSTQQRVLNNNLYPKESYRQQQSYRDRDQDTRGQLVFYKKAIENNRNLYEPKYDKNSSGQVSFKSPSRFDNKFAEEERNFLSRNTQNSILPSSNRIQQSLGSKRNIMDDKYSSGIQNSNYGNSRGIQNNISPTAGRSRTKAREGILTSFIRGKFT